MVKVINDNNGIIMGFQWGYYWISIFGGFHKWGDPKMDVLDNIGTSYVFMDDDWGYPHDETEASRS